MGRTDSTTPIITSAYAVVANDEPSAVVSNNVATAVAELDRPDVRRVRAAYADIPETQGLTWNDEFFDDDDDVVAVFDLDYERMVTYYSQISWSFYIGSIFVPNCFWLGLFACVPCYLDKNVNWAVRSQHLAITRDGVRFVQEQRHTMWGAPCTDAGKTTKTIPFDKITDCHIIDPAGNSCCCVENTLHVVNIDTTGHRDGPHELTLAGVQNPQAFKKLVWAMKRHNATSFALPASMASLDRGNLTATDDANVASLLRDIRDELRQHNAILQTLKTQPAPSSSPTTADIV